MAGCPFSSRRGFLAAGGLLAATAGLAVARERTANPSDTALGGSSTADGTIPFHGTHQGGIATPQQTHTVLAAFDVTTTETASLVSLLQAWTRAAERLTAGQPVPPASPDFSGGNPDAPPADSGEARGLAPRRLTLTFGFGPGLFEAGGRDRFGLAHARPAAFAEMPSFNGDQLDPSRSGGDLCVQACADDPMVAFHAIRQLARMAAPDDAANGYGGKRPGATAAAAPHPGVAVLRWMQTGFLPDTPGGATPRNLLGFRDGSQNPGNRQMAERDHGKLSGDGNFDEVVWVGDEGPSWMQGGTYLVLRRIRLSLEHWDRTPLDFQEQVIGRRKDSGAPLSGGTEMTPLDLDATDANGDYLIPENAHVRLASASQSKGARMLRRTYSYNDGLSMVAERWPPWRQGLEYDAGLLFVACQRDLRTGFIPMFTHLSEFDLLNQYATHVASAAFAVPGGIRPGGFIGEDLFSRQA